MSNNAKVKPRPGYIVSATFFAFVMAAMVGVPLSAASADSRTGPDAALWCKITFILGASLFVYSALPKPRRLLKLNWLVLPLACTAIYLVFLARNPDVMVDATLWIIYASLLYTRGIIFLVPLAGLIFHVVSCAMVEDRDVDRQPLRAP